MGEGARAQRAGGCARPSRRDQVAPVLLAGQTWLQRAGAPQLARCDCRSCQSRGQSRGSRAVATCPFARRPPGPKWCPRDVQVASNSRRGTTRGAKAPQGQVGGLHWRSGKGYARSRDCDVGWLEPVERPAGQPFPRASQRACLVQCGNEVPTAALTASPPVPNLGLKHANAALLQLRKCEGKSGRSGRRDGGRGSIEISGHWPSCRPGLLWHWSSYRR